MIDRRKNEVVPTCGREWRDAFRRAVRELRKQGYRGSVHSRSSDGDLKIQIRTTLTPENKTALESAMAKAIE
jgi:hypothetical protein